MGKNPHFCVSHTNVNKAEATRQPNRTKERTKQLNKVALHCIETGFEFGIEYKRCTLWSHRRKSQIKQKESENCCL